MLPYMALEYVKEHRVRRTPCASMGVKATPLVSLSLEVSLSYCLSVGDSGYYNISVVLGWQLSKYG
jgi:hypothetical protein